MRYSSLTMNRRLHLRIRKIDERLRQREGVGLFEYCERELNDGRSLQAIANQIDVPRSTLSYWLLTRGMRIEKKVIMPDDLKD